MNPSARTRSRPLAGPALAYSLSHLVFGLTSLARGLLSYADGETVTSAFFLASGVLVAAFVAYETVGPGTAETPDEWNLLVYASALGALLFAAGTVWQYS
ncbi:hypothetical protein [Halogeometricum luteum]|uniref:Uncharacterized protein n=1 Tax=Halogeometricum luteum TaxID=2950537 RepID=A0ABU2FXL1_9EURY|nr:hypothetical protein [Halogeometricum sp. S3BR5-2]MDS0292956.1 hypothetical protein [Halogeometricum sp. S3BR5-2]